MENCVDPTREAFEAFKSLPRDKPIDMLNLLKFHDKAQYPTFHPNSEKNLSGAEAYGFYGETSAPVFKRLGGKILWRGRPENLLIGPPEDAWDLGFIARYPGASAFLAMVTDPEYQKHVIHRQAAVRTSRLIRFGELPGSADKFS